MGLLDRFKKAPGPDALTWEAVARARAVPGVAGAEVADADTVHVTWLDHPGTTTLSLAEVRDAWSAASGFDRIELMDQVVAGLAPPPATPHPEPDASVTDGATPAERHEVEGGRATGGPVAPASDGFVPGPAPAAWAEARATASVAVVPAGAGAPATGVRWRLAEGIDAVATVAGRPVTGDDLARWDVGADDVRAGAVDRLVSEGPALDPIGPGVRAWVPTSSTAPPPAWLAAPGALLAAAGVGEAVALAPLHTELVIVDPDDAELLASVLSSTAAIVEGEAEVLLPAPLLVSSDGCRPWRPEPDHPCASLVERLRAAG